MKRNCFKRFALCLLFGAGPFVCTFAGVVKVGDTEYTSLNEAVAAAEEGQTVTLMSDVEVTEMIPVTKSITLYLDGHTITNNVVKNRLFRLSDVTFTIDGNNGRVVTPETNTQSYGFIDFRDAGNVAGANTSLITSNVSFKGGSDGGSLFAFRGDNQSLTFNKVNVELTESYTYSIINGYQVAVNINVIGGDFICRSTNQTAGVFQAGAGSTINFTDVNVDTTVGPIFDVVASDATFTNCTMKNTATDSYFASCIAPSNGANVTIDGGSYEANYAVYVFNSGGKLTLKGDGKYKGSVAAVQVDRTKSNSYPASAVIEGGTFTGNVINNGYEASIDINGGTITGKAIAQAKKSSITITEGTITDGVTATGIGASINIEGGTVEGDVNIGNNSSLAVSGGNVSNITDDMFNVVLENKDGVSQKVKLPNGASVSVTDSKLKSIVVKENISNAGIRYTRNFSDKWQALFVPFRITLTDDILANFDFAEIWDTELIDGAPTIEYIKLEAGSAIEPNTPCLVKAKTAGEQALTVVGTLLAKTEVPQVDCSTIKQQFNFVGVYDKTTLLDKNGYFLNPDEQAFRPVASETQALSSCRFYLTIQNKADGSYDYYTQDQSKVVKIRVIGDDNQGATGVTGIEEQRKADADKVYSLQGTYVGNSTKGLQPGVYIAGGKKVIVKL